ncbi:Hpt domain-containing protein [Neptunicoccus cionae]|uniref:Hpt domain-containing protein n=1 Tax=Neptunicoccus cionae TaxID=2035344 RepID=UPI000C760508|nr:Hpt domain-containing protein [Amylibacter cionae]PLS22732.1 hypothetical protein C0U40_00840 [Amylibacter cionae]
MFRNARTADDGKGEGFEELAQNSGLGMADGKEHTEAAACVQLYHSPPRDLPGQGKNKIHWRQGTGFAFCDLKRRPLTTPAIIGLSSNRLKIRGHSPGNFSGKIETGVKRTKGTRLPLLCQNQLEELLLAFGAAGLKEKLGSFLAEGNRTTANIASLMVIQDHAAIQSIAHKFGGSCALFGAKEMRSRLTRLELSCTGSDASKVTLCETLAQRRWQQTKHAVEALPYFR